MATDSYIDTATLLSPTFSPHAYANTLTLNTNNSTDTPLDLSTPLSRVLFDVQEIDTKIDNLTTANALPIIDHASSRATASSRVLEEVEGQVRGLQESYERLQREVEERYEKAAQVQLCAERLARTLRLGRGVQRALALGRQLQAGMEEVQAGVQAGGRAASLKAMPETARTVLELKKLFVSREEGEGLDRVRVVSTLRQDLVVPAERNLIERARQLVREFSMSSLLSSSSSNSTSSTPSGPGTTFRETEETRIRATSAMQTLYLLSPTQSPSTNAPFEPTLLIQALTTYLQTSLTSSLASLSRALATLPTLDRALLEISARCQNLVALEKLLSATKPPSHPQLSTSSQEPHDFLLPLLSHLDTSSLPSYFWRTLASQLSPRVLDILNRGGVSARTLRSNRDRVRDAVRECVDRGSRVPGPVRGLGSGTDAEAMKARVGGWEREAAVMVGAIMGPLQGR